MIIKKETLPDFDTFADVLAYDPDTSLFFDIETTGFSPAASTLFLIGVLHRMEGEWLLTQFLAEEASEEEDLLRAFISLSSHYRTLLHFNGSTFDLPYITKKAAQYQLPLPLPQYASIDLYQKLRPVGKLMGLKRMNQSAFEALLGWQRSDQLTGKHMVSLFEKYAASKEKQIRDLLLLHNHDDMVGMTKLLPATACLLLLRGEFLRIEQAEYLHKNKEHTHPDRTAACSFDSPNPLPCDCLRLTFTLKEALPVPLTVENTAAVTDCCCLPADDRILCRLSASHHTAVLQIPAFCGTLCHFFADYKNYYYLPLEDQAIHKSVAGYVDPAYRIPAKASTCYIKKTGQFLPQPSKLFTPAFQASVTSSVAYFEWDDSLLMDHEQLTSYLHALLLYLFRS